MGMGMLFAGALTGAAQGVGQLADETIKQRERDQVRQQSIMDRRNELLFEMKAKSDMARKAELDDAQKYDGALGRAETVGNDRRFAKFKEDIRASGGGDGMDEAQLRDVFNQSYNQKQSTAEAGGDRYVEAESRGKADVLDELRKGGASGGLLKTAREDLTITQRGEQQARSEALKEKQLEQRDRQFNARLDQQNELADKRNQNALDVADKRASGKAGAGGLDQTEKLTVLKDVKAKADATRPKRGDYASEKKYTEAMTKWGESEDGQISQDASRQIRSIFGGITKKGGESEEGASAKDAQSGNASGPYNSNDPQAKVLQGNIDGNRRSIERIRSGAEMKDASEQARNEAIAMRESELRKDQAKLDAIKSAAQPSTKKDNPTTTLAGLPQGAKQIGTSGGKPVYELPDGRKVVAK